jgi:NADPH-dependent curcumin reductase CurA
VVRTAYGLSQQFACTCTPAEAAQGDLVHIQFRVPSAQPVSAAAGKVGATVGAKSILRCEVVAVVGRDHTLGHDTGVAP